MVQQGEEKEKAVAKETGISTGAISSNLVIFL
jgi:hypothetical protein